MQPTQNLAFGLHVIQDDVLINDTSDNSITVVNLKTAKVVKKMQSPSVVEGLNVTNDPLLGPILMITSADRTIRLWKHNVTNHWFKSN